MTKPLTERQQRFVTAYLASGNATDAARVAGYANPNKWGPTLVKHGGVKAAIRAKAKPAEEAVWLSREERLIILSNIALGKVGDAVTDLSGMPIVGDDGKPLTTPAKVRDRVSAMTLISKMNGELLEKREHSGPGGGAIPVRAATREEAEAALAAAGWVRP